MIEICYQDDDGVTHAYTQENSPAILSELEPTEECPAEADGPALALESLATDVDSDKQGRDPIRAYLRKMSSVALLTREGEVDLGKRIEDGQRRVLLAILNSSVATRQLVEAGQALCQPAPQVDTTAAETDERLAEPHEAARTERIRQAMDDVRRVHARLLVAESDTTSPVQTTRERARREVAITRREMADALLTLRLDPKHLAGIIAQLRSLMACIVAAHADIAYCEQLGSKAGVAPDETARLAELLDNAKKAIRLVEEEVGMPEQVLRDTLDEIRQGELHSEKAKAEMVKRNLRLVIFIAKKYINHSELHFMDLVQEGNIGLIKAVERYDYRMGFKFATYAMWWVRQAITFAMADQSRTIRVPAHVVEVTNKVRRTHRQLIQKLGREATAEEIAKEMDLPIERINDVLNASDRTVSLDTPIGTDGDAHLGDFIEDESVTSAFDSLVSNSLAQQTRKILATLSPREQEVLRLRFGIDESPAHTLEEVGKSFDLTRERIRQIEAQGLEKLRLRSRALGLHTFIESRRSESSAERRPTSLASPHR
jgi:RNA polymerase primary sigma factor